MGEPFDEGLGEPYWWFPKHQSNTFSPANILRNPLDWYMQQWQNVHRAWSKPVEVFGGNYDPAISMPNPTPWARMPSITIPKQVIPQGRLPTHTLRSPWNTNLHPLDPRVF